LRGYGHYGGIRGDHGTDGSRPALTGKLKRRLELANHAATEKAAHAIRPGAAGNPYGSNGPIEENTICED
jgi:hypothetical protein